MNSWWCRNNKPVCTFWWRFLSKSRSCVIARIGDQVCVCVWPWLHTTMTFFFICVYLILLFFFIHWSSHWFTNHQSTIRKRKNSNLLLPSWGICLRFPPYHLVWKRDSCVIIIVTRSDYSSSQLSFANVTPGNHVPLRRVGYCFISFFALKIHLTAECLFCSPLEELEK